jgi:hypothetical protein
MSPKVCNLAHSFESPPWMGKPSVLETLVYADKMEKKGHDQMLIMVEQHVLPCITA